MVGDYVSNLKLLQTCFLSNGQQEATSPVSKRGLIV